MGPAVDGGCTEDAGQQRRQRAKGFHTPQALLVERKEMSKDEKREDRRLMLSWPPHVTADGAVKTCGLAAASSGSSFNCVS